MTRKISYHAQVERKSRIEYIIDTFKGEFGSPVVEVVNENDCSRQVLTSNGIWIVYNLKTNRLVTMWIATVEQGVKLYKRGTNGKQLPKQLMKTLHNNKKACENQPKN